MIKLRYDLHIHSCLSPCAADEMTPGDIIGMAAVCELEAVGVADHNSCLNLAAAARHADEMGLLLVPAMELTTTEEVHVLCLFPGLAEAMDFSERVRSGLPEMPASARSFGNQLIIAPDNSVSDEETRMLSMASNIGIYDIAAIMDGYNGIAIPAHVDRPSFSLYANLGFYDPTMDFKTVEISRYHLNPSDFLAEHPDLTGMKTITNSDAHDLDRIPDTHRYISVSKRTAAAVIEALRGT